MSSFARRCLPMFVVAAILLAASCRGGESFDIPDAYRTSNEGYTLLYSTVGYELAGPKRLLIRQNDVDAEVSQGLSFAWRLVDDGGGVSLDGRAHYSGTGWGIPVWTIDFSGLDEPGTYRIVVEGPNVQLATQPFAVDEFLLFRTTFVPVALDNAIARQAPIELDNGFFDSNGKTGSTAAHADWLVGLIESYERRRNSITEEQRRQMRDAIGRAVDYVLLLADPATGEFQPGSATRGSGNSGPQHTASGVRALARYAATFHREDPTKAERAHRRALLAEQWLLENAPEAYPPALQATVNYDFYRYALVDSYLAKAADAVRAQIGRYDLRSMQRPSDDSLPHVEGLYRMWRDLPTHPDHELWTNAATAIAAQYKQMLAMNPFAVLPPGVTDAERGTDAIAQWDEAATDPPPGDGNDGTLLNTWFMARSIDASYLADMTGDAALSTMAAAGIGWITGLNPGVPSDRVGGSESVSGIEAASFLTGLPVRTVDTWSVWEWVRPRRHGTLVSGFGAGFDYDDGFASGESWMADDGLWLYAMTAFEDSLQPARRAPSPVDAGPFERAIHVASADSSRSGNALQLVVHVVDQSNEAVPGARVIVLWEGTPNPDALLEEAQATSECLTGAEGSCLATLSADALAVTGTITAAVSNLEHPSYAYDIDADNPSKAQPVP